MYNVYNNNKYKYALKLEIENIGKGTQLKRLCRAVFAKKKK